MFSMKIVPIVRKEISFTVSPRFYEPQSGAWRLPATEHTPTMTLVLEGSKKQQSDMAKNGIDIRYRVDSNSRYASMDITPAGDDQPVDWIILTHDDGIQLLERKINQHKASRSTAITSLSLMTISMVFSYIFAPLWASIPIIVTGGLTWGGYMLNNRINLQPRIDQLQRALDYFSAEENPPSLPPTEQRP